MENKITRKKYLKSRSLKIGLGLDLVMHGSLVTLYHPIEPFDWIVVIDGQGVCSNKRNIYVQYFMNMNWDLVLSNFEDPMKEILKYTTNHHLRDEIKCGCSISLARVFANRCELWNIGNTQCVLFVNGALRYYNMKHDYNNPVEADRLKTVIKKVIYGDSPKIYSGEALLVVREPHCLFPMDAQGTRFLSLQTTQMIGYGGITGVSCKRKVFKLDASGMDRVRLLLFSDGFSNMIMMEDKKDLEDLLKMDAFELIDKVYQRWMQKWALLRKKKQFTGWGKIESLEFSRSGDDGDGDDRDEDGGSLYRIYEVYDKYDTFLFNYDDISIGIWDNRFVKN